jgi:predicted MFS family arabinose efflux permease
MGSFDSLRYRNYRLLWTGAILSNIGTWMQAIALSWYVFLLTRSAFWVSFVTFVNFVPTVISPIGGVYTDRLDRKRILMVTQAVMMVDAAALALLAWAGHANLAAVMLLTLGQGLAFAFNAPTWMAFVPSLVPPEALVNAIALNSAQFSLARVIGPAIAGGLIALTGAALVFGLNALSYVAVLVALILIRTTPVPLAPERSVRHLLAGGIAYTWRQRRIRAMIGAIGVTSFFAAPVTALLPVYAADVYGRGSGAFGSLAAAMGVGSVVGALLVSRLGNRVSPAIIASSLVLVAVVLVLFASVRSYVAGLLLMAAYGAAFLFAVASTNGYIQLNVEETMRGRVLSLYLLAFGLFYPVGSLLAGIVAETTGVAVTTAVGGIVCGGWGIVLLLRFREPGTRGVLAQEPGT